MNAMHPAAHDRPETHAASVALVAWPWLCEAWFSLNRAAGIAEARARCQAELLACAYQKPDRHYHNLAHIEACLRLADAVRHRGHYGLDEDGFAALRWAIWFHDLVDERYDKDGVVRSGEAGRAYLQDADACDCGGVALGDRVLRIVLATDYSAAARVGGMPPGGGIEDDPLLSVMRDIDLSILGAEQAHYGQYAEQIRQEYAHVEEGAYRAGRSKVLLRFLAMPHIYANGWARHMFEDAARTNLQRELEELQNGEP
ncbi:hypothetical protein DB346_17420 [Verrucomicrobia bacterium LW23]|nr:hypothetical protein DB346_17420 [Verrucomicrobia bacterium LW23]